jgi:hypothetical protein
MGKEKRKRKASMQKRRGRRIMRAVSDHMRRYGHMYQRDLEDEKGQFIDAPESRSFLEHIESRLGIPEAALRALLHGLTGNQTRMAAASADFVRGYVDKVRAKRDDS